MVTRKVCNTPIVNVYCWEVLPPNAWSFSVRFIVSPTFSLFTLIERGGREGVCVAAIALQ